MFPCILYAGNSVEFDGTDDFVAFSSQTYDITYSSQFTISLWCYIESTSSARRDIISKQENNSPFYGWHFSMRPEAIDGDTQNRLIFTFNTSGETLDKRWKQPVHKIIRQWTHLAITHNGSTTSANINLYINGVCQQNGDSVSEGGKPIHSPDIKLGIGCQDPDNTSKHFDGRIDNIFLYDTVLSTMAINHLCIYTPHYKQDYLIKGINMDEDVGGLYDYIQKEYSTEIQGTQKKPNAPVKRITGR